MICMQLENLGVKKALTVITIQVTCGILCTQTVAYKLMIIVHGWLLQGVKGWETCDSQAYA